MGLPVNYQADPLMEFFVNKKSVSQIAELEQKIGVGLTFVKSFLFFSFLLKT